MDTRSDVPGADFEAWCLASDALPAMLFAAARDGSIEFVNRAWTAFTGYSQHSSLGNAWIAIVHPDEVAHVLTEWRRAVAAGDKFTVETRARKRDGSYVWLTVMAAPLHDAAGSLVRWYGSAIDIDARKRAEEALKRHDALLRDSERRFRALAEAIPVICWTADPSGWIDWYNHRWYEFTGQRTDEAAGWGWQTAHHPDDLLKVMEAWPRSIATGDPFEMEFRLRRHDGVFHWFLTRVEPLRDEHGTVVRWYGSAADINEQKKALERSNEVAETFQQLFLPRTLPQRPHLQMDAVYLPAEGDRLVGGDWFDAFELPDGRIGLSIGDVAGHGLDASLTGGKLRQAIVTLAFQQSDPAAILAELDRMLSYQQSGIIVTALVAFVDRDLRTLTYASAGHPPPLVARAPHARAEELPARGAPMGAQLGVLPMTYQTDIPSDGLIALYTDGLIEFSRDILQTQARLRDALGMLAADPAVNRPATAIKDLVFAGARPRDDAALLVLQFASQQVPAARQSTGKVAKRWRFHSSDAHTASSARQSIRAFLAGMALDQAELFSAELIVGEIIANTVAHAPGLVEVEVDWTDEKPSVIVRDKGPGFPSARQELPDAWRECGRGLFLIRSLSETVSIRPARDAGTEICATLPIRRKISH
ncbi:MAG: PAS domain S-box protein [Candidatus Eremiobacteraeota bacterium]|nr:PAS domain S-box protein [Candidatus Eremiobacteraeota bacterium]MBV8671194.1 PAS domain S-box protein [Candidatus Eremiobacteraeota bacterium]